MKSVLLDTFLRKDPLRGLTVVEVEGPDLQLLLRLYFRSLQFLAAASSQLCKGDSERKNEFKRATSASKVPGRPREGLRDEDEMSRRDSKIAVRLESFLLAGRSATSG